MCVELISEAPLPVRYTLDMYGVSYWDRRRSVDTSSLSDTHRPIYGEAYREGERPLRSAFLLATM